ncbi:MAG: hypothetical protein KDJ65_04800 [Anaerolineae bacterium]|nr:hypothetical protein [Anaerolineae bacterium]
MAGRNLSAGQNLTLTGQNIDYLCRVGCYLRLLGLTFKLNQLTLRNRPLCLASLDLSGDSHAWRHFRHLQQINQYLIKLYQLRLDQLALTLGAVVISEVGVNPLNQLLNKVRGQNATANSFGDCCLYTTSRYYRSRATVAVYFL